MFEKTSIQREALVDSNRIHVDIFFIFIYVASVLHSMTHYFVARCQQTKNIPLSMRVKSRIVKKVKRLVFDEIEIIYLNINFLEIIIDLKVVQNLKPRNFD